MRPKGKSLKSGSELRKAQCGGHCHYGRWSFDTSHDLSFIQAPNSAGTQSHKERQKRNLCVFAVIFPDC